MEIAQDVARKLIESYIEHGDPLPAENGETCKDRQKSQDTCSSDHMTKLPVLTAGDVNIILSPKGEQLFRIAYKLLLSALRCRPWQEAYLGSGL